MQCSNHARKQTNGYPTFFYLPSNDIRILLRSFDKNSFPPYLIFFLLEQKFPRSWSALAIRETNFAILSDHTPSSTAQVGKNAHTHSNLDQFLCSFRTADFHVRTQLDAFIIQIFIKDPKGVTGSIV